MEAQSRVHVLNALNHIQPDKVPFDLSGHRSSGINPQTYRRLRQYLDLPERPVKVYDIIQQIAVLDEDFLDWAGVDTIELGRGFSLAEDDWKPWILADGTDCLIPAYVDVRRKGDDWLLYGGSPSRMLGIQKPGMNFFDQNYWPYLNGVPDNLSSLEQDINNQLWAISSPPNLANIDEAAFQEGAKALRASTGRAIVGLIGNSMHELPQFLCRMDNFLMLMASEPQTVHRLQDALIEIHLKNLEYYLGVVGPYIDILLMVDDLGTQTGPLLSPKMYREFLKPRHSVLCNRIKELADVKILLHCCGGIRPLLDDLIDAGFDAVNPVQISCKGMETQELKKDFGDRICFWGGGCDTQSILPDATPEEIRQHVLEQLEIFSLGGGYVFQQVHNIMAGISPENIVAMINAVKEFNGEKV